MRTLILTVSSPRRGGLSLSSAAMLVAIGLVVLLVSLPRLREFALRENEEDARALVERLAGLVTREVAAAENPSIETLLASDPTSQRQLDDLEYLDGGTRLRRHGYLFEVGRSPTGAWVRAWPWEWRKTGIFAYAWNATADLVAHPNDEGHFSGPQSPPRLGDDAQWRGIER
ncbi:MAG: hypothetical protein FJ298_15730 [Planctomycetes bacterium]|nr:hypothetical protein [Planctomycetota bacterium]